jgi:hypothetical protein
MAPTRWPLSGVERAQLLRGCIPFALVLATTILVATVWSDLAEASAGRQTPLVVGVIIGIALLTTGSTAVNRVRDLLAGAAVVEQDQLTRLWRPRRRLLGDDCHASFERLGTLRLSRTDYDRASTAFDLAQLHHPAGVSGGRAPVVFRVTYSRASRIAWSLTQV